MRLLQAVCQRGASPVHQTQDHPDTTSTIKWSEFSQPCSTAFFPGLSWSDFSNSPLEDSLQWLAILFHLRIIWRHTKNVHLVSTVGELSLVRFSRWAIFDLRWLGNIFRSILRVLMSHGVHDCCFSSPSWVCTVSSLAKFNGDCETLHKHSTEHKTMCSLYPGSIAMSGKSACHQLNICNHHAASFCFAHEPEPQMTAIEFRIHSNLDSKKINTSRAHVELGPGKQTPAHHSCWYHTPRPIVSPGITAVMVGL